MCELCSNDKEERDHAIAEHKQMARFLRELAEDYEGLAHGTIDPHRGSAVMMVAQRVNKVIRFLVTEWI